MMKTELKKMNMMKIGYLHYDLHYLIFDFYLLHKPTEFFPFLKEEKYHHQCFKDKHQPKKGKIKFALKENWNNLVQIFFF